MASISLTDDELRVVEIVGPRSFLAARPLVAGGAVRARTGAGGQVRATITDGGDGDPVLVELFAADPSRAADLPGSVGARCSCGGELCHHVAATLLTVVAGDAVLELPTVDEQLAVELPAAADDSLAWQAALAPWVADLDAVAARRPPAPAAGLGVQVEVTGAVPGQPRERLQILVRPVRRSQTGAWVRGNIGWDRLGWASPGSRDEAAWRALVAFAHQVDDDDLDLQPYYGYRPSNKGIDLVTVRARSAWDALLAVRDAGAPFVLAGRDAAPVALHDPVEVSVQVIRRPDGLGVEVRTATGDDVLVPATAFALGDGTTAVAWWQPTGGGAKPQLHLAPVPAGEARRFAALAGRAPVTVAAHDEEHFFADYLPALRRAAPVRGIGVSLPEQAPPRLRVTVEPDAENRLALSWGWAYALGSGPDPAAQAAVLDGLRAALPALSALPGADGHDATQGRAPAASVAAGMAAVRVVDDLLPVLAATPGVEIEVRGELPAFRPAAEPAVVTFAAADEQPDHDWFDLAVTVTVDGAQVPFQLVFAALATGDTHVVLSNGTYFDVTDGRFAELAAIIEESRQLNDGPSDGLRVSRYQADLWADLEELGVVTGQARQWLTTVQAIAAAPRITAHETPPGLRAQLRPYQAAGFGWLASLYDNQLGGVLADDMGLGKTVQTLALFCHARAKDPDVAPFLVVAPTSVVTAWVQQARAFTPDLTTVAVSETAARRGGATIADLAAGAHVVVTSYALFRIEREQYDEVAWAGLVLDEAQSVKNHATRGYHGARTLAAPFKLAISGTPLENNLMELWSLLSIVAPGLLASPQRFTEFYRTPIERERDADRLALLRRRIAPLMLRRTKELVAADLPDKSEQVIEVVLAPKHRRAYDRLLQRERRKVLGLVDDVNRNRFQILRSLTVLRQASLDAGLADAALTNVPASKLDVMMELVEDLVAEGHRALIFSQFTRFLGAARQRIAAAGIDTCYLDGRTSSRGAVIEQFRAGTAPVFLISLKAGGTGVTLTEADYCILLDPWWNPATENQAIDRTHRIGQTRNVHVYRLVAKDTIEEKVMALKAAKAELFSSVLDGGEFVSGALTEADIRALIE